MINIPFEWRTALAMDESLGKIYAVNVRNFLIKYKRKSLLIDNNVIIYKDEKGQIVDKKTWMKISENRLYLLYDIDHNKIG